jgi:hypothetical protein
MKRNAVWVLGILIVCAMLGFEVYRPDRNSNGPRSEYSINGIALGDRRDAVLARLQQPPWHIGFWAHHGLLAIADDGTMSVLGHRWDLAVGFTEDGMVRAVEDGSTLERNGRHILSIGDSAGQVEEVLGRKIHHALEGRESWYVIIAVAPYQDLYVYLTGGHGDGRAVQFILTDHQPRPARGPEG